MVLSAICSSGCGTKMTIGDSVPAAGPAQCKGWQAGLWLMGSVGALGMSPASFLSGGRAWPYVKTGKLQLAMGVRPGPARPHSKHPVSTQCVTCNAHHLA